MYLLDYEYLRPNFGLLLVKNPKEEKKNEVIFSMGKYYFVAKVIAQYFIAIEKLENKHCVYILSLASCGEYLPIPENNPLVNDWLKDEEYSLFFKQSEITMYYKKDVISAVGINDYTKYYTYRVNNKNFYSYEKLFENVEYVSNIVLEKKPMLIYKII